MMRNILEIAELIFTTIPPVTNVEVCAIVDYEAFYQYLKEVNQDYLTQYSGEKSEVEACLEVIKHKFNIA
jgi:hypothetical protein